MFNLLISIIAIALVTSLAGASLYYGSDAFSDGTKKALIAKLNNNGQQVKAALTLYKTLSSAKPATNGDGEFDLDQLVTDDYLSSFPEIPDQLQLAQFSPPDWEGYRASLTGKDVLTLSFGVRQMDSEGETALMARCAEINEDKTDNLVCGDTSTDSTPPTWNVADQLAPENIVYPGSSMPTRVTIGYRL